MNHGFELLTIELQSYSLEINRRQVPATILHVSSGCQMRVIFKQLVNGHDLLDKGRELIKNRDVVRDLDFIFQRILIFLISPTYQFEEMCKNNDLGPLLCSRVAEF